MLADKYKAACTDLKVKVNSSLIKQLPENPAELTALDLNNNVVGTRGVVAVLRIVKDCPNLATLNLRGNNLQSPVTKDLLDHLADHPGVQHIDLSENDIRLGGPELVQLLKRNTRITTLGHENCFFRPLFERLIGLQLAKNQQAASPGSAGGGKKAVGFAAAEEPNKEGEAAGEEEEGGGGFGAFGGGEGGFGAFGGGGEGEEGTNWANYVKQAEGEEQPASQKYTRRATVSAEVYQDKEIDEFVAEVHEKDEAISNMLFEILEKNNLFSHLEDFELQVAVDAMKLTVHEPQEFLYKVGDEGSSISIVVDGNVEVTEGEGESAKKSILERGGALGELMLLYPGEQREEAKCLNKVAVATLDRHTYKCILSKASKKKRAMYEGFLSGIGFLKGLAKAELLQLADALKPASYTAGDTLIKYGETGENFFIIVEGVVEVFGRNENQDVIKVCEFTNGDCVGELEFINKHLCVADVKAKGFVRTAKMNRHHFEMVMGPVKEVLARTAQESTVYEYYRGQLAAIEKERGSEEKEEKKEEKKEESK